MAGNLETCGTSVASCPVLLDVKGHCYYDNTSIGSIARPFQDSESRKVLKNEI